MSSLAMKPLICRVLSSQGLGNKQLEATFQKSAEHLAEAEQMKKANDGTAFSWLNFLHCLELVFFRSLENTLKIVSKNH